MNKGTNAYGKAKRGAGARWAEAGAGRTGGRPAGWALDALFAAAATLALAAAGGLEGAGALPGVIPGGEESALFEFYEVLPAWGRVAFGAWQATATLLGLVLPVVTIAVWGRRGAGGRAVRGALAPYALLLLWQVLIEIAFARAFFPNIVVFTGLTYTAYRIRQLLRSRRAFAASPAAGTLPARARRFVGALLAVGLVFWAGNLAFLLSTQLPRVVELP